SKKAIFIKKFFIIWRVVIHSERRMGISFYKKSPECVIFPKVYGAVHGFHTTAGKPVFCSIRKQAGSFFVINTFKETDASSGLFMQKSFFKINESSYTPAQFALGIL